jgi:hypothetical protein
MLQLVFAVLNIFCNLLLFGLVYSRCPLASAVSLGAFLPFSFFPFQGRQVLLFHEYISPMFPAFVPFASALRQYTKQLSLHLLLPMWDSCLLLRSFSSGSGIEGGREGHTRLSN